MLVVMSEKSLLLCHTRSIDPQRHIRDLENLKEYHFNQKNRMETAIELQTMNQDALIQMTNAETENQIAIAKRFPREVAQIKKKFLSYAICDQETAASMFYKKPVDNKGTFATGPSIRMAEIAANTYQNIKYGSRVVNIEEKWVTVQGIAIDLENNLSYTSEVKRSIWSEKGGYRYSQSMIETTLKAAGAFAVRDAIFKVVPLALFNAEIKEIKLIAAGSASGIPLDQRIKNAFAHFAKLGVTDDKILKALDVKKVSEITEDHMADLVGFKNAIADKEATVEEIFNQAKVNKDLKDDAVNAGKAGEIFPDQKK
jgi:hypothetical protein